MDILNKKYFIGCFLLILIAVSDNLIAQKNLGTYSTVITEQGYAGLKFRYKAFIRTEMEDSDATASIWLQINI